MKNIILLGITSLLTDISSEMVYPILGLYLASLNTPFTIIGMIEGIAESVANLLKVFSGQISDKLKRRKPFVIFGYSFSTLGKVFLYLSKTWFLVLIGRIVDRFGKGIRTAPRDALISESTTDDKKGKVFGLHRAMDTLGAVLGVVFVYFIFLLYSKDNIPFNKVFLLSVFPALLAVIVLFFVKEKKSEKTTSKKVSFRLYDFKYVPSLAKRYILISVIFALGNSSNQFLLLRAKNVGFSYVNTILLYLVYNLSYTLFSYPAGILSDKIGKKIVITSGYLIYSLVYLLFAIIEDARLMWILFVIYGIYIAIVEGQEKAFLSEVSSAEYRATILGLHYTLVGFMLLPASFIAGFLWDKIGPVATFLFGSFMSLISFILMIFMI